MRTLLLSAAAAATLVFGAAVPIASAAPAPQLFSGIYTAGDAGSLQQVQFIFGGRNYCWYDNGWRGPGFYWCGYAFRSGLGWGGGAGWHGWRGGGGGGVGHGPRGGGGHGGGTHGGHGGAPHGGHGGGGGHGDGHGGGGGKKH